MSTNAVTTNTGDRLKIYEAVGATALVVFVASAVTISFAFLAFQCLVSDTLNHIKKGLK